MGNRSLVKNSRNEKGVTQHTRLYICNIFIQRYNLIFKTNNSCKISSRERTNNNRKTIYLHFREKIIYLFDMLYITQNSSLYDTKSKLQTTYTKLKLYIL